MDGSQVTAELLVLESYPVQYVVVLRGVSPSPCHQVLVTLNEPNVSNEIHLDARLGVYPDAVCAQVLSDFSTEVHLGSFPEGEHYTIWVNGVQVAEFTA